MANHEKRYVNGYSGEGLPLLAKRVNRNSPCTCGSGRKQKNCCGCETKYFKTKKKQEAVQDEKL